MAAIIRVGQRLASLRTDDGQQSLAAREVAVGRAGRDADPPGRLAEDDAVGAVLGGEFGRRNDQRVPQVTVVVGPGGCRRCSLATMLTSFTSTCKVHSVHITDADPAGDPPWRK